MVMNPMVESVTNHQKKQQKSRGDFFLVDGWTTHLKNMLVKIGNHFPRDRGKNKKSLKISILLNPPFGDGDCHVLWPWGKKNLWNYCWWLKSCPTYCRMYKTPVNRMVKLPINWCRISANNSTTATKKKLWLFMDFHGFFPLTRSWWC